jgi:hypothetical protein
VSRDDGQFADLERRARELEERLRGVTSGHPAGGAVVPAGETQLVLAGYVLQLADLSGMPDSVWATDRRVTIAREILGIPVDGRYTHQVIWENIGTDPL